MSSLKRKRPEIQESPSRKKIKTNKSVNYNEQYQEKRAKIIQESENKINILKQQIEKEKKSTEIAMQALNKEFPNYLHSQNETIKYSSSDIDFVEIHFESDQNAKNCMIKEDFTTRWKAEFRVKYQYVCGWNQDPYSMENKIKINNTFSKSDIIIDSDANSYFVLAKASFMVIQIWRLCNIYGLETSSFVDVINNAPSHQIVDLLDIMDIENPATFKFDDEMNKGGEHQNIVFISNVEVNINLKGHQFGTMLVQRIIDNFGDGMSRILLKPFPLQWETKDIENDKDVVQFKKDRKKVINVWEQIGFKQIGKSEYWGRNQAFLYPLSTFGE